MGLSTGVAIISVADVEAISGEVGLAQLDGGNATLANALIKATDYLITDLRFKFSIDPAKIANTTDLIIAASLIAAYLRIAAQPGQSYQDRAEKLKARYEDAIAKFVFVSSDAASPEQTLANKGLPRTINMDSAPFFGPTDNRWPGTWSPGGFVTR